MRWLTWFFDNLFGTMYVPMRNHSFMLNQRSSELFVVAEEQGFTHMRVKSLFRGVAYFKFAKRKG